MQVQKFCCMFRHEEICVCFVTYFRGRVYTMQDGLQTGDMFTLIYIPLRHSVAPDLLA